MNFLDLPIYRHKADILSMLRAHQVMVLESPTGSGKTTQLPIILHESGVADHGVIGVTQPRRIAAVSVAQFIARHLGQTTGQTTGQATRQATRQAGESAVAYKMRFEDTTDHNTRIKIMTDGTLLQELQGDPLLKSYSAMIIDEAHERSLNIDFILGLLKRILAQRDDLKVIISSATINAAVFGDYFAGCPILRIDAPVYPVELIYQPIKSPTDRPIAQPTTRPTDRTNSRAVKPARRQPDNDELLKCIVALVDRYMASRHKGDILVFLSGEAAIKNCIDALKKLPTRRRLHLLPLYGRLSKEEQERVFLPAPPKATKVVVATNIAETSITIDNVSLVIDSGLAKINFYNPRSFTASLVEGPISKASADQRRGRAGRTRPGICYRLYSHKDNESRPHYTTEEIYRTDLSEVVLRMAGLGIRDFESFDFISPPGTGTIASAVETLHLLHALEVDNRLTPIGTMMTRFPLLPRHARMIVEAIHKYPTVIKETITAASFLSSSPPFLLPSGMELEARAGHHRFSDDSGDFVSYLKLAAAYQKSRDKSGFCERHFLDPTAMHEILNVRDQLIDIVGDMNIPIGSGGSQVDYLCAISAGLLQFVCVRSGRGIYRSLTAEQILIHPGSVMYRTAPRFIVAGEIVRTSRTWARSVSPLQGEWLALISPELAARLPRMAGNYSRRSERTGHTGRSGYSGRHAGKQAARRRSERRAGKHSHITRTHKN